MGQKTASGAGQQTYAYGGYAEYSQQAADITAQAGKGFQQAYREALATMEERYAEAEPISRGEVLGIWAKTKLKEKLGVPIKPIQRTTETGFKEFVKNQFKYQLGMEKGELYTKKIPFLPITYASKKPPSILDYQVFAQKKLISIPRKPAKQLAKEVQQTSTYRAGETESPRYVPYTQGPMPPLPKRTETSTDSGYVVGAQGELFQPNIITSQAADALSTAAMVKAANISVLPQRNIGQQYKEAVYVLGKKNADKLYRGRTELPPVYFFEDVAPKQKPKVPEAPKVQIPTYYSTGRRVGEDVPTGHREVIYKEAPKSQLSFDFYDKVPKKRIFEPIPPPTPRKVPTPSTQMELYPTAAFTRSGEKHYFTKQQYNKAQRSLSYAVQNNIPRVGEKLVFGKHRAPKQRRERIEPWRQAFKQKKSPKQQAPLRAIKETSIPITESKLKKGVVEFTGAQGKKSLVSGLVPVEEITGFKTIRTGESYRAESEQTRASRKRRFKAAEETSRRKQLTTEPEATVEPGELIQFSELRSKLTKARDTDRRNKGQKIEDIRKDINVYRNKKGKTKNLTIKGTKGIAWDIYDNY